MIYKINSFPSYLLHHPHPTHPRLVIFHTPLFTHDHVVPAQESTPLDLGDLKYTILEESFVVFLTMQSGSIQYDSFAPDLVKTPIQGKTNLTVLLQGFLVFISMNSVSFFFDSSSREKKLEKLSNVNHFGPALTAHVRQES